MSIKEIEYVLSRIGEEQAEEFYKYFRSRRFSFSAIHKYIELKKLLPAITSSKPVQLIARQFHKSRMFVYRLRKKFNRKPPP
ncbi:MAG: hypothetical protein HY063_06585 [Bacteroidetes bacterium]|nr:hypothetical protein [Bacteroidota bacterium]